MNVSKSKAIALLIAIVLTVSVVAALTTNYFIGTQKYNAAYPNPNENASVRFASAAKAIETDFTVAADLTVHAVVHVKIKGNMPQQQNPFGDDPFFDFFFGPQQRGSRQQQKQEAVPLGAGSGVIISPDGYIVTNNHVIARSTEIEVTLNDKRTFKAKLIGTDPVTDLALIKIDGTNLPTIPFGDSDALKIGEWVLAVGNPFNLTSTVTAGIVSAKARNIGIIAGENNNMGIESFIQTDAAINPGNSGGALVNTKGELVGINAAIASQTGSYAGYGFAIPTSIVKKVVTDLRQHGTVQRALLGVEIRDIDSDLAKQENINTLSGAYVSKIQPKSAAEKAGVKAKDVITNVNGVSISSVAQLQEQVSRYRPGDKITLGILRDNKPMTLNVQMINAQGNTKVVTADANVGSLGAAFKEIDTKVQKSLGLDYGLQIQSLTKGKFNDQGIKPGFIVIKINNSPIRSEADVQQAYQDALKSDDKVLYIAGVYPNGKVTYYAINLED